MTWRERIVQARKRGYFTRKDYRDSADWANCAVGEQARLYPQITVRPVCWNGKTEVQLERLGQAFSQAVGSTYSRSRRAQLHIDWAEQYLDQIEDRVLQLKRESQN